MMEQQSDYITFPWLPEWFQWNTQTQEGRTLDRPELVIRYGKPFTRIRKGTDPLQWSTCKSDPRPRIQFQDDGKKINLHKYELIWMAYHMRPIPKGYDIHHIDFDWTNNAIENLQLLTAEEHRKIHSKQVVAVDGHNRIVLRFTSTAEAERHGFDHSAVSKAARGVYYDCKSDPHKYKGLYWYFESDWLAMQQQQQQQQQPTQQLAEPTIQVDTDGQLIFSLSSMLIRKAC